MNLKKIPTKKCKQLAPKSRRIQLIILRMLQSRLLRRWTSFMIQPSANRLLCRSHQNWSVRRLMKRIAHPRALVPNWRSAKSHEAKHSRDLRVGSARREERPSSLHKSKSRRYLPFSFLLENRVAQHPDLFDFNFYKIALL